MTTVNLQLNDHTHRQAMPVLSNMGMTLDDAVNLMLLRIAKDKRFPFANGITEEIADQKIIKPKSKNPNYRLGALPNINVPDNFDDIEISEFDV